MPRDRDGLRTLLRAGLAVACLSTGLHGVALAQGPPAASAAAPPAPALEWAAPPGCPEREQVLAHIGALARGDVVEWARFEVVRGRISGQGGLWVLELEFVRSGAVSRRRVESARCGDLAQAAAVAIVLAHRLGEGSDLGGGSDLAESRGAGWNGAAPTPPPSGQPEPAADEVAPPLPHAAEDAPPIGLSLGARALLDPTTLGTAAFGVELGAAIELGAWSAGLYGVLFPSVETPLGGGQAIALGLAAAGVSGCRRWAPGLGTCVGMELGQLRASPLGLEQPSAAHDLWVAPNASLELSSRPFAAIEITAGASVLVPLVRGEFRVDDAAVHRVPALAFRLGLGLRVWLLP